MKKRLSMVISLVLALALTLSACSGAAAPTATEAAKAESAAAGTEAAKAGGDFVVAVTADLGTFDQMINAAGATSQIMYHVLEQLAMLDYNSKLNPQLATSWETNADNTEWTLKLKQGVKFHNGSDFDADDVIASLERYKRMGQRAAVFADATFEKVDQYTVKVKLAEGNPLLMETFGAEGLGGIVMLPAEVCGTEYDTNFSIEQCIGTGPYKFKSYEPDTEVVLEKFADYVPDAGENAGFGGEKIAYFDTITWKIVPDAAQRLNGLLAGEYQYAADINTSAFDTINATDGVEVMTIPGIWIPFSKFNGINSPFADIKLRQALMLCIDMDACMAACVGGNKDLYETDGSMFFPSQAWYKANTGADWYNKRDIEKAKALMAEAGYKGEKLTWCVTQDYQWMYDVAVVVQQQAAEAGFNIELDVNDWATCVSRLTTETKEKDWDIFTTGFSYPDIVDPTAIDSLFTLDTIWPYESAEMDAIVKSGHSSDMNQRVKAYHDLMDKWYEDMYGVIYGKFSAIGGYSSDYDICQQYVNLRFFNCKHK